MRILAVSCIWRTLIAHDVGGESSVFGPGSFENQTGMPSEFQCQNAAGLAPFVVQSLAGFPAENFRYQILGPPFLDSLTNFIIPIDLMNKSRHTALQYMVTSSYDFRHILNGF